MRSRPPLQRASNADIAAAAALVVAVAGAAVAVGVSGWTLSTSLVLAVVATAAVVAATLLRRQRARATPEVSIAVVGAVLVAALTMAVAAGTTWTRVTDDRIDDTERQQIASRAADITQLLITVAPESRAGYADRLRPVAVTGIPEIAEAEILHRIPESETRTGTIRAVGVDEVTGDQAGVTVVIEETEPQILEPTDGPPSQVVLALGLKNVDGQWKLATVAAATP